MNEPLSIFALDTMQGIVRGIEPGIIETLGDCFLRLSRSFYEVSFIRFGEPRWKHFLRWEIFRPLALWWFDAKNDLIKIFR